MKKLILFFALLVQTIVIGQISTSPSPAVANAPITINFNKAGTNLSTYNGVIYAHIGVTVNDNPWQQVIGNWGNNSTQPALTFVSGTTYKLEIPTNLHQYFNVPATSTISQICVVFRNAAGNQQWPTNSALEFTPVGAFQVNLTAPANNSSTLIPNAGNLNITANNTGGNANYVLKSNGNIINTQNNISSYSFNHTNITSNQSYELEVSQNASTTTRKFSVIVNKTPVSQAMPSGLEDGINYNNTDFTKATLVLNAPFKDFVYVAGTFNNYNPSNDYLMKKDPSTGKFWLEINNLTPNQSYNYQYWVGDQTNLPTNSPALVKTADPFSTLVLSPFDDPEIHTLGIYPNLPQYPSGQEREVTVLQTGVQAHHQYQWSNASQNFIKPDRSKLVIYEVLVRDFDANRTYQDLINRIDYFKNLNINAVQLMPVMEFEGNESWGYNTSFHMALDKRYGSEAKLKEFIDLCHQNGIAVILDIALNHVYGRSALERMWMTDTDGDGWANGITSENPYCNANAMHSYSVGRDLNHFNTANLTQYYVERTIAHWIENFKIDGFRWDLTKGFTNNCPAGSSQESCTNNYQADRVSKLKEYADMQWQLDPTFYVIFEHLGNGGSYNEEVEWANYRKNNEADGIAKGIMHWRKMTDPYANFLKGNSTNLSGVTDTTGMFIGYAESHDEERVLYKATKENGQVFNNLPRAHKRMSALGAVHLLVPGPKMIYHFGDLGYESSIFTCNNGTVNTSNCKLDTKPQPQWTGNWLQNVARKQIYDDWSHFNLLKKSEAIFSKGIPTWNFSTTGKTRLDINYSTAANNELSRVIVLTNMTNAVSTTNVTFPFTGTWYNLMDNSTIQITNLSTSITIDVDGFKVFGNQPANLSTEKFNQEISTIYPNPTYGVFSISSEFSDVTIFNLAGQIIKTYKGNFQQSTTLDVSEIPAGIYLVQFKDKNQQIINQKLVKN